VRSRIARRSSVLEELGTFLVTQHLPSSELNTALRKVGKDWNFDTLKFSETAGSPVHHMGMHLFKRFNLKQTYSIKTTTLTDFLKAIESGYFGNSYHNATHAADVMSSMFFFIERSILLDNMSEVDILASIIATLGHDIGHPGLNNRYMVNSKDDIALRYND
jgi:hypothetical protein